MKHSVARSALVVLALLVPSLAEGGIALAPIMQHWHRIQRQIDAMIMGGRPYRPAAVRASLQLYAADAQIASAAHLRRSGPTRGASTAIANPATLSIITEADHGSYRTD